MFNMFVFSVSFGIGFVVVFQFVVFVKKEPRFTAKLFQKLKLINHKP